MFLSDLKHENAALEGKLRRLYELRKGAKIDLSFRAPYLELLKKFGDPHKKLPPLIHVAGTNGKGSTIATLKSMLESGGYKVHAYTSPHLVEFNERIYLAGKNIDDAFLESLIDRALELNTDNDITFFEITTAIAFAAFAQTPADILLLETGLGGRLDCTNIIEKPLLTIITSIGLDHAEYLGDSLCKIAGEKAGIMKQGVPCIIAAQDEKARAENVLKIFKGSANKLGARLYISGAEWFTETMKDKIRFVFKAEDESVEKTLPLPGLFGIHQIDNCGTALGALRVIEGQFPLSDEALARGLKNINWPARLQNITENFKDIIPEGWEIWLDGAHNENAARILSTQATKWHAQDGKNMHLILGMMNHKNPADFLNCLTPAAETINFVSIPGEPRAFSSYELVTMTSLGKAYESYESAIAEVTSTQPPGRILLAGSLYLAGHVLKTMRGKAHNRDKEATANAA